MTEAAKIVRRDESRISNWVRLVAKETWFSEARPAEVYHCFAQPDYVAILAQTRDGLLPIVRQFRPAVEEYTWEFPAGLMDAKGENAEETCRRELEEETGLTAESVVPLGTYFADTGRLENKIFAYFVRTSNPSPGFVPEDGMMLEFVSVNELYARIRAGTFRHQLHLGLLAAAAAAGIDLATDFTTQ